MPASWAKSSSRSPPPSPSASRLSAEADLSDPHRHPFQHRLRADPRARMGRRQFDQRWPADPRPRAPLGSAPTATARRGSRAATSSSPPRSDRGLLHAAAAARRFPHWFERFLPACAAASPRPCSPPRHRQRPQRRQDCASRRPQPQPRLVLARLARCSTRRWPRWVRDTPTGISKPACRHVAGDYMGEHWLATFACSRW